MGGTNYRTIQDAPAWKICGHLNTPLGYREQRAKLVEHARCLGVDSVVSIEFTGRNDLR